MKSRTKKTYKNGFTLIEILLVLLISSILLLGIDTAYRQAILLSQKAEYKRTISANARLLTETLREELTSLYLPTSQGEQEKKQTPFELASDPNGSIMLSFYTLNGSWRKQPYLSKPLKIKYSFTKREDSKQCTLARTEQYSSGEKIIGPESSENILIDNFEFKIFALKAGDQVSEQSWQSSLKCQKTPPKALKIYLNWPGSRKFAANSFQTIIKIPAQAGCPLGS